MTHESATTAVSADEYEERMIAIRLDGRRIIYIARAEGHAAAERLRLQGRVTYTWGDGRDQGLMLVQKASGHPQSRGRLS